MRRGREEGKGRGGADVVHDVWVFSDAPMRATNYRDVRPPRETNPGELLVCGVVWCCVVCCVVCGVWCVVCGWWEEGG